MTTHVIEGTWEEIERHKAEFVGYHLRVTVTRMRQTSQKTGKSAKQATVNSPQPRISAMGKYAGILSSEDFMRQKQEEIELEDRARKWAIIFLTPVQWSRISAVSPEPGVVDALLNDPDAVCYAHSINLCEVFYDTIRKTNLVQARQTILDLHNAGVIEWRDMNRAFWQRVGTHKARGRISMPDCFCISLAQELAGELVTSDHSEFDPLVPLGIVPINFIR